jgi:hypothetical protein
MVAAALVMGIAGIIAKEPEQWVVPLKFHVFSDQEFQTQPYGYLFTPVDVHRVGESPRYPSGFTNPRDGWLQQGTRKIIIVGEKHPKEDRFTKIWVDFNANGKLEPNEVARYTHPWKDSEGFYSYSFKLPHKPSRDRVFVRLCSRKSNMVGFKPCAGLVGQYRSGLKRFSVTVVDTNLNGRIGDTAKDASDSMVVESQSAKGRREYVDMQRLDALFHFPNDQYYKAKIKNGNRLTFTLDKTPLGAIRVNTGELKSLYLSDKSGSFVYDKVNATVKTPKGSYQIVNAVVEWKGQDGFINQAHFESQPDNLIHIDANRTTVIDFGGPYRLNLSIDNIERSKTFDLTIFTRLNYRLTTLWIGSSSGSLIWPKEPELTLTDPLGNVVSHQTFTFG